LLHLRQSFHGMGDVADFRRLGLARSVVLDGYAEVDESQAIVL
jgi:hypothetical protein